MNKKGQRLRTSQGTAIKLFTSELIFELICINTRDFCTTSSSSISSSQLADKNRLGHEFSIKSNLNNTYDSRLSANEPSKLNQSLNNTLMRIACACGTISPSPRNMPWETCLGVQLARHSRSTFLRLLPDQHSIDFFLASRLPLSPRHIHSLWSYNQR